MPRTALRWRDLVPGAVVLAVLVALVVGILALSRIGTLRGETFRLHVLAGTARDITSGSDVWLVGQRIGTVVEVRFRAPSTDTSQRLLLELDVLERARPLLAHNSTVEFRAAGSLLGALVVDLSPGTPDARPIEPGDTLIARPPTDLQDLAGSFADVGTQLPVLRQDAAAILGHLRDADGTIGAAARSEGFVALGRLQTSLTSLTRQLSGTDDGSLGPMLRGPDVRARAGRAAARADSIRQLLASDAGSFGRFRRDSTLVRQIAEVRDEISVLRLLADSTSGTVGRARHDGVIAARLAELEQELGVLIEDVKKRPFRYLHF